MSLFSRLLGLRSSEARGGQGDTSEPLAIVPIPPLIDILAEHEKQKGGALTREEVDDIAAGAICMTMAQSRAAALAEARGYADIDPANAWEEWQQLRSRR